MVKNLFICYYLPLNGAGGMETAVSIANMGVENNRPRNRGGVKENPIPLPGPSR
jgi:hypothetical protein